MSQNPINGREEYAITETSVGSVAPRGRKQSEVYEYDFAKQGGGIGDIYLRGEELPEGAKVTNSYLHIIRALTGASAQVAVTVEAAGDIQTAAAVSGSPWSTVGLKDTVNPEPGTESGYIDCTVRRAPKATVSVAGLTDGKFYLVLEYDVTE